MPFDFANVGKPSDAVAFPITVDQLRAYANATNDPISVHKLGEIAPPVFGVVPAWEPVRAALYSVTPPEAFAFIVHGEQDMHFHAPLRAGTTVESIGVPIGVHVKPTGTTVVVKGETRSAGELLLEQYFTAFFRTFSQGESAGETAPAHKFDGTWKSADPVASFAQQIDPDQTVRYAEASGDHNPIHLDAVFAQSVGLPGIIVHGLCTMAFLSWGVITSLADSDPQLLARLAVRFSRPVLPGDALTTSVWQTPEGNYAFETTNSDGKQVIKDGLAELR